ncbi:recombinase family protein [Cereibacter changlensis]|uniref:recombinase family protein n=1 Tax=Cereibacter changlensis TaxID=402884 RepID=UPI004033B22B
MLDKHPKTTRKMCVIYCRVSSTKQTSDGAGLSSQERSCREYAKRCGYDVAEVFTDVISGRHAVRPGMNELLAYLKRAKAQEFVVVVDDVSRFARDVSTHSELRNKILSCGAALESPNQKFGEDAGSRFIEIIMAAIAAHDREKNAEQSHSRTIARLKNGYWVFRAPLGYGYVKAPGGVKMLERCEPVASIMAEALNGFATGRFQSQAEVKRFLDSKPEFPKDYRGTEVRFDRVTTFLKNVVYAGYVEKSAWDVPLTKGQHEPLISYDTYLIIQDRLNGKDVAPARTDIDEDFPLRGFLVCDACGHRLTACWSQSRTGRKYPYYLCYFRRCPEKGKSTPRDKVEEAFDGLLKSVVPAQSTFDLAERMFRDAWDRRASQAKEEENRLRTKSRQIDREVEQLLDRAVRTKNEATAEAYERRVAELHAEKRRCCATHG